ncbi:hypothetical protein EON80_28280, partial [bacterium]
MHMLLVIAGGVAMLGLFLLFSHLWGGTRPDLSLASKVFIPVWLLMAIANMWIGVAKAGYSVRDEFPILLLVFSVPA